MRLLIVEDNADLAAWLAKALRQTQYTVDIAADGLDAEHMLRLATYSAVILDLSLPKLDGITVLKQLRRTGNKVPVIILTANASLEGVSQASIAVRMTISPSRLKLLSSKRESVR